ncbi:MAG: PTS sugar transporter subunit IIA [Deltaproteobacteria bacterium]|nr:PTS sugar transporter subunit IIA [Deltaproteobacteria bacterium]
MIGVVIVAHGRLAQALVGAAEFIVGQRLEGVIPLEVSPDQEPEELQAALKKALAEVDKGQGVLLLTDMFGGSPSDMSISFLDPGRVEVLTGVNLPLLLHVVTKRNQKPDLTELAEEAEKKALDSITMAGKVLKP